MILKEAWKRWKLIQCSHCWGLGSKQDIKESIIQRMHVVVTCGYCAGKCIEPIPPFEVGL